MEGNCQARKERELEKSELHGIGFVKILGIWSGAIYGGCEVLYPEIIMTGNIIDGGQTGCTIAHGRLRPVLRSSIPEFFARSR